MKKGFLTLIFLTYSFLVFSQNELYMPTEFQKAYKNKTRSFDGNPGVDYWQNYARYDIEAEIEPKTWKVKGHQKTVYFNNSPDTLTFIILKTYANHYKKGSPRANNIPLEDLTDGMLLSDLNIDHAAVDLNDPALAIEHGTFITVKLPNPLPPRDSLTLEVNWETQIPLIYVNRIGAYDDESAFMGYWYPKIAVYDDIDGWDKNEYLGTQEFYNDFADFNVRLSLPESYFAWATGTLQNPKEVFSEKQLKQYLESLNSSKQVIINKGRTSSGPAGSQKTWVFKAKSVTDFAAGFSNNFRWESSTVQLENKKVSSNIVFDNQPPKKQDDLLKVQNESLLFLSNYIPNIEFPYTIFTSFFGVAEFDGMEFPMMANDGFGSNEEENADVIFHEIAHTYFPFYTGINEVKYSWMEEGWAAFFTIKFIQKYYEGTKYEYSELDRVIRNYLGAGGKHWESPLFAPTNHLVYGPAHVQLSYKKPAFMYLTLEDMLGKKMFLKCLSEYILRWAGKHPTPYDFMFTFNDISKQDLNWFWNAWIFQYGYADLAITQADRSKVRIENIGRLPMPVFLKVKYKNGSETVIHNSADVWRDNPKSVSVELDNFDKIESVELMSDNFPDIDKSNNMLIIK